MTVHTTHPHRISATTAAVAFAGAVLAAGAGYGVATLVLDEEASPSISEPYSFDFEPNPDVEPGLFPGTNREERALMHRR